MDFYKETLATWNKIAALYQEKFMDLQLYDETYAFFCDSVSRHQAKVLDIGCGPGNISKYLQQRRPDFNIDGIDASPNMIALAQANIPQGNFRVMDCRDIKTLKAIYDGIICGFCLPYLGEKDVATLISDSHSLLTENGWLYLSFVEGDPKDSGFISGSTGDRAFFHYYRFEDLKQLLLEIGFELPVTMNVTYHRSEEQSELHSILLSRKKGAGA